MDKPEREIDPKLDYLGKGIDCRKPSDTVTWLDELDHADYRVRNLDPKKIRTNPVTKRRKETRDGITESKIEGEGSISATPHESLQLGANLEGKKGISKTTKYEIEIITTKIATMHKDVSEDLNPIIGRDGAHYTKYEEELSWFILKHIMETKGASLNLKGDNSVIKLDSYLDVQHARAKGESAKPIWQTIADACDSFVQEKVPYTQYASSISLGAVRVVSHKLQDSSSDIAGGFQGKVMDIANANLKAGCNLVNKINITSNWTRGEIDSSGTVKVEEVIEIILEPVSNLLNTQELETIMKRLLQLYSPSTQYGPFRISCREHEQEIYWQVDNEKVYGTTVASKASSFYVECKGDWFYHMIHKTSKLQTEMHLMIKRPFDATCPLVLVQSPKRNEDTCFILIDTMKKQVKIPQIEDKWKGAFYIKLPAGGLPILGRYTHPQRFISVKKCEESTTSKYSTASCARSDMKGNITLFYFTPVVRVRSNSLVVGRDHGEADAIVRDNGDTAVEGAPAGDNGDTGAPVEDTGDTVLGGAPNGDNAEDSAVNRVVDVGAVPPPSTENRNINQQLIHGDGGDNGGLAVGRNVYTVGVVLALAVAHIFALVLFFANTSAVPVHDNKSAEVPTAIDKSEGPSLGSASILLGAVVIIFMIVIVIGVKLRRWLGGLLWHLFLTEDEIIKQQFIDLVGEEYVFPSQAKSGDHS